MHTPGPWKWDSYDLTGRTTLRGNGDSILNIDSKWFDNWLTEDDARLIATTPDLLEALEMIDSAIPERLAMNIWAGLPAIQEIARAAIAKATQEEE